MAQKVMQKTIIDLRFSRGSIGWVVHRFPIKGGISLHDAMRFDLMITNTLLVRLNIPRPFNIQRPEKYD